MAEPTPDPHALLALYGTHVPAPEERQCPGCAEARGHCPACAERRKVDVPREHRIPTRVFVLGVNERRVTLYSQQCRALNLIWLLHETGVLTKKDERPVAIVGAGAGGLTAAAAAACKGHGVILLNDRREPMPQQRFARHRWLHPRIFDWPAEGWHDSKAHLPVLDWKQGDADAVRRQILEAFDKEKGRARIEYVDGVENVTLEPAAEGSDHARLGWSREGEERRTEEAAAIVLAVGFGVEERAFLRPPVYRDSYWDDPGGRWVSGGHVLISGGGDGGLTEVLHAALGERFAHKRIVALAEAAWRKPHRKRILQFEQSWRHRLRPAATAEKRTLEVFGGLDASACDKALHDEWKGSGQSRADEVTILADGDDFSPTSCALNRFLVARLAAESCPWATVKVVHDRLREEHVAMLRTGRPPFTLEFAGKDPVKPDKVIFRHGTVAPRPLDAFAHVVRPDLDRDDFTGTTAALLDVTRRQQWGTWYDSCPRARGDFEPLPDDPRVLGPRDPEDGLSPRIAELAPDDPALPLVGAIEAAALAGCALTPAGVERVIRDAPQVVEEVVARIVGGPLPPAVTVAEEAFLERRRQLLGPDADLAAWRSPSPGEEHDERAELLWLGHQRAGTLAGAAAEEEEGRKGDGAPWIGPMLLDCLEGRRLPAWAAYGYAAARHDDPRTQVVFARQLVARADEAATSGRGAVPATVWDEAYGALRRAVRTSRASVSDREYTALALLEAADLARRAAERPETMGEWPEELADRWELEAGELTAIAVVLALEAVRPRPAPRSPLRLLLGFLPLSVPLPAEVRKTRLPAFTALAATDPAASLLARLGGSDVRRVVPRNVADAVASVPRRTGADDHLEWMLGRH